MSQRITRRRLLRRAVQGAGGMLILRNSASAWGYQANERLNLAHIGAGGRGRELLLTLSGETNTVALCDVNENKAMEMYRRFPDAPKFQDFRQMLDKMHGQIDAVVVATPDHTHAVASAAAIRAGKHVYTEKPLTRTIHESRVLRDLARRHTVATSMGNQGTASHQFRRALELIRGGVLGRIREIYVWNDSGGAGHGQPPAEESRIPPYLDWDLWLGPAAFRPFHPRWMGWHQWRAFGTGQLGNWASHTANLAFMALKVDVLWRADAEPRQPIRIEAAVEQRNGLSFPRWEMITWNVPPRGELPAVQFHWYNGSRGPGVRDRIEDLLGRDLDWGDKGEKKWADFAGCLIIGTEGMIHATGHNATFSLLPAERFEDVKTSGPEQVERSQGHERDWLAACRGGGPAWSSFEYAVPLNEFLQLGNLATQFEGPLEYDASAAAVTNNREAHAALGSEYREGWAL